MRPSLIQRLPIRWVILCTTLGALSCSLVLWSVGAYWLGQSFLWYSQEYRMIAQVRMVWTGEEPKDQGNRRGLPVGPSLAEEAQARVDSLTTPATHARIFDQNGQLLAASRGEMPVPAADDGKLQELLGISQEIRNRHLVYAFDGPEQDWMVLLLPLRSHHQDIGVLQFCAQRRPPKEAQIRMLGYLGLAAAAALLTSIGIALWVSRWLAIPLERLREATLRLQQGDFKARTGLSAIESRNEVYQISAAFDQMAEYVERSLESQRRFVADASHELKTPLTSIGGMADMLKLGQNPDKQQRAVEIISRETDRMARLVADLLTLSKAGQKPAEHTMEHLNLSQVVKEVVETATATSADRQVQLRLEDDLFLVGNRDEISRMLRNLVDNALKHTAAGTLIEVRGHHTEQGIVLEVADHGPGIEACDLPHLFERFYRPDTSRARRTGGSGLGLAIVESIAQRHGGKVSVTSEIGKGSCFRVTFGGSR